MKTAKKIKSYPNQIHIYYGNKEEEIDYLTYEGQQGEYTRTEWLSEDEIVSQYDDESKEEILRILDNSSNIIFFKKDENEYEKVLVVETQHLNNFEVTHFPPDYKLGDEYYNNRGSLFNCHKIGIFKKSEAPKEGVFEYN